MNRSTLEEAVLEAERFLGRARWLLTFKESFYSCQYPKEQGAVRRASMDLTRKLADLRQNR